MLNIKILIYMNTSNQCYKCLKSTSDLLQMECQHQVCVRCLPSQGQMPYLQHITYLCEECSKLSKLQLRERCEGIALEHLVICWECMKGPFLMEEFIDGVHRNHPITSVRKSTALMKNKLSHHSESITLENQALYRKIDGLSHQKKAIQQNYALNVNTIKMGFLDLKNALQRAEDKIINKYENEVSDQTFKIDQQIKEYQRRINQCSNYLNNIDAHCRQITTENALEAVTFYLNHGEYLSKFVDELCSERVEKPPLLLQDINISVQDFYDLERRIGEMNVLQLNEKSEAKEEGEMRREVENFFQKKKKEIFSSSSSPIRRESPPEPKKTLCQTRKIFDIDARIDNLRKIIHSNGYSPQKLLDNNRVNITFN